MNNELFDRMMKDNLNKVNVAPSQGLKKSIGRKLFFQNLLNFHKVKVIVATLFIGTAGVLSYNYIGTNTTDSASIKEYQASNETIERLEIVNVEVVSSLEKTKNEKIINTSVETVNNQSTDESIIVNSKNVNEKDGSSENNIASIDKVYKEVNKQKLISPDAPDAPDVNEDDIVENNPETNTSLVNNKEEQYSDDAITLEDNNSTESHIGLNYADPRLIDFNSEYITTPSTVKEEDISFKNKPLIRKELSVDIHKSVMATNDVDNSLKSLEHQEFHWDFYQENESLKTSNLGGIDVNYAVGTKTIKGKASIGFNASQIVEQKPIYEFDEITDPVWLEVFEVDELAWVNTYGEDTCTQCFFAHNTKELQDEMKNENNTYKYVSVPLRLGAEVNLKYVSLDVMGGIQWNHLTSANGVYVMKKTPDTRDLYYWNDMEVSAMNKDNDMLKRNYLSWTASANFRVRITRQFDLLAGYDMVFSNGNITKDRYIMDKSLKYAQAKVGITFYPNRVPLLKK